MKKIRESIFETNSSSTHNISFKFKKQQVPLDKLRISGDTCVIYGIDQGDLYPLVSGERDKLDYIFTWMYIRDDNQLAYNRWNKETGEDEPDEDDLWWPESDKQNLETGGNNDEYQNVLEAIKCKYPEVERICFKQAYNSSFDHQTSPYEEDSIVDLTEPDEIYYYLFNDHITVEIGHD